MTGQASGSKSLIVSGTRYFLYDGGMPLLELDASKNISTSYLYGADGVVYRRIHGATTSQDKYEYHHTNPLGSNIVLTDSQQKRGRSL